MSKDMQEARERGEVGMEQAAAHADRDQAGWTDGALAALRVVADKRTGTFTFEELRDDVQGLSEPPDLRAWGAVAKKAIAQKIIRPTGSYAARASGNCAPAMTYVSGVDWNL